MGVMEKLDDACDALFGGFGKFACCFPFTSLLAPNHVLKAIFAHQPDMACCLIYSLSHSFGQPIVFLPTEIHFTTYLCKSL